MRPGRGFTLLELAITLAVLAILLLEGLPAMSQYLQNRSIRTVAGEYTDGLRQARMQAIHRNSSVSFAASGTGWEVVALGVSGAPNTTLMTRTGTSAEARVQVSQGSVTFDGTGETLNLTGGSFSVATDAGACSSAGGPYECLEVTVSPAGAIRMCNPALSSSNPQGC